MCCYLAKQYKVFGWIDDQFSAIVKRLETILAIEVVLDAAIGYSPVRSISNTIVTTNISYLGNDSYYP